MTENKTLVNLSGGAELTVQHLDGKQEKVIVRCLHIKEFPALMRNMGNECAQAEIFTGKDAPWAETLTNQSVIAVYEKGHELNDDFFVQWSQRRLAEQEKFVPGITARLTGRLTSGSLSSPSDQASASPKP